MNLYLLKQTAKNPMPYDCHLEVVVIAENEDAARELAALNSMDEGCDTWLDKSTSSCNLQKLDRSLFLLGFGL